MNNANIEYLHSLIARAIATNEPIPAVLARAAARDVHIQRLLNFAAARKNPLYSALVKLEAMPPDEDTQEMKDKALAAETEKSVKPQEDPKSQNPVEQPEKTSLGEKQGEHSGQGEKPMDSAQGDEPMDSAQGDKPMESARGDKPMESALADNPMKSAQEDKPMDSSQGDKPMESAQGDKPEEQNAKGANPPENMDADGTREGFRPPKATKRTYLQKTGDTLTNIICLGYGLDDLGISKEECMAMANKLQRKYRKIQAACCDRCNDAVTEINTTIQVGPKKREYNMNMFLLNIAAMAKSTTATSYYDRYRRPCHHLN